MNYFRFYVGDYSRDTSDLTLAEHGAFLLLLCTYYGQEKPIPAAPDALYRITRAMTAAEQKAVRAVADRFFPIGEDGLRHNARTDSELAIGLTTIAASRENGKKGGRPKKSKPEKNPVGYSQETQQEPSGEPTNNHPPTTNQKTESPIGDLSGLENPDSTPPARKPCPHDRIVALYHELLPELRQVREWNDTRRKLLARRWAESTERQSLDWWREFFGYVRKSRFLMGQTTGRDGRPFDCDLEWLIRPTNFAKVVEGKYEDAP